MSPKSLVSGALSCVLVVSLFGCSADVDERAGESVSEQSAALIIVGDCTASDGYNSTCLGKGGYLTCDGGTMLCCKDKTNTKGQVVETLCAANVNEISSPPPPPAPTVYPGEPAPGTFK
jgi:hypothetical protein